MSKIDTIKRMYLSGSTYREIGDEIDWHPERVRKHVRTKPYYKPNTLYANRPKVQNDEPDMTEERAYPQSIELKADGSALAKRVLRLTERQLTDHVALMEAHGLDPEAWTLTNATNNIWHQQTAGGGQIPLYQSKITIKPISDDWAKILRQIKTNAQPLEVTPEYDEPGEKYLLIACNDLHFGKATYEDYIDSQQKIVNLLVNAYEEAVIYLAGDLLDTDNFRGMTAHGTIIGEIDMGQAWADLCAYIEPMIVNSLKYSKKTSVVFCRGNHSESMEWAFVQYLKVRFPQAVFDDSLDYAKAIMLGKTFIALSHGYKKPQNLITNISKAFSHLWGQAEHYEVIVAHQHKESTDHGVIFRVLPTRAPSNDWGRENNFLTTHPAFQCFEYGAADVSAIYYV